MADKEGLGRVERKARGALDGRPTNAKELAALVEKARAEYVLRWRANPAVCAKRPDILSDEKWYGDGSSWTDERIKAALDPKVFDPAGERVRPKLKVVMPKEARVKVGPPAAADRGNTLTALKPWVAEGISRRTWYSRRKPKLKGGE